VRCSTEVETNAVVDVTKLGSPAASCVGTAPPFVKMADAEDELVRAAPEVARSLKCEFAWTRIAAGRTGAAVAFGRSAIFAFTAAVFPLREGAFCS